MPKLFRLIDGNNMFHFHLPTQPTFDMLVDKLYSFATDVGVTEAIYVFDGFDSRARRRAIYPEYKRTASRNAKPKDSSYIENYQNLNAIKEQLELTQGVTVLEMPKTEADDLIGLLANRLSAAYPDAIIEVFSTDRDFHSLGVNPNMRFPFSKPLPNVEPKDMLLYKALVGDPSDNIKGRKGFGQKSWEKLPVEDRQLLEQALKDGQSCPIESFEPHWPDIELAWKLVNFVYDQEVIDLVDSTLKDLDLCQNLQ